MFTWINPKGRGKKRTPTRVVVVAPQRKKGKGKKKGKRGARTRAPGMNPYVRLLADPCNAELVPGMHGPNNGYLSRMKKFVTLGSGYPLATNSATCGYIIWAPRYHTAGTGDLGTAPGAPIAWSNCFVWLSNDTSRVPANTTTSTSLTDPAVYGAARTNLSPIGSAYSVPDPAAEFVGGGLCQDARLISACMKVTYLGTMNASDGQFCFIKNIPLNQFLYSSMAGASPRAAMSVDRCFELADHCSRLGLETHEVRNRDVGTDADRFIGGEEHGVAIGTNQATGPPVVPGTISALPGAEEFSNPNVIGFAFRGFTAGQLGKLSIEMYKNFEWRPSGTSGVTAPAVKQMGTSKLPAAETWLDRNMPSWETMSGSITSANMARFVQLASTGYDAYRGVGLGGTRAPLRLRNGEL